MTKAEGGKFFKEKGLCNDTSKFLRPMSPMLQERPTITESPFFVDAAIRDELARQRLLGDR